MSILIFILWFFHIQQRIFYYLYFWQLKMYRIDRFWEEIQRNKRIILPQIYLFVLIFLLLFYLLGSNALVLYPLAVFYFILSCRSLFLLLRRKWKLPVLTKKMIAILSLGFIAWLLLSLYFWQNIVLFILLFELLLPLFIFFSIVVIELPAGLARRYLMLKASKKRGGFKDLLVIGITGSYGKSSTKEFLYTLLSEKYGKDKVLKTVSNVNTEIGIANTVLRELKKEHEIFVCEMGAYRKGEIRTSCNIVKPKVGIITGVNEQHLATFGTMENLLSAEGGEELIDSLPKDGMAFFNAKNKYCLKLYEKIKIKKFLYGQTAKLLLENIEGAKAVAKELGMTEEETSRACQKIKNQFPGIQLKKGINALTIINATYSANPDGVIAHLEYLKTFPGKKIIVMPCLIELGKASKEIHKRIGQKIGEVCDLAIITTKDRFKEIKESALGGEGGMKDENILFLENLREIFEKIKSFCSTGDVILLESRVPAELIRELVINNEFV